MLKKSVLFVCVALMLVPAATYAVVVSDCETSTIDGWAGRDWETPGSVVSAEGMIGVTSGNQSLKIEEGGAGWKISAMLKFQNVLDPNSLTGLKAVTANWLASTKLECDITVDAQASADPAAWLNVELLSNSQNGGWYGFSNAEKTDDINPAYPGSWQPQNQTGPVTHHVTYSLAGVNAKMQAAGGPGTWFEIFVIVNNSGFASGGNIYIDNVKLTGAPKVAWVSFSATESAPSAGAAGTNKGFTAAVDKLYTDQIKSLGYEVTRVVGSATPDVNMLNAMDLIIASRSTNSGNFQSAGADIWNGIKTPLIHMSGYAMRKSRLGWVTASTSPPDTTGDIKLTAIDPTHPIFAGISLDANGNMVNNFAGIVTYPDGVTIARGISVQTDPLDDNGQYVAVISEGSAGPVGGLIIAEFNAGDEVVHDGGVGTNVLAGHRLMFLSGSRETSGVNSETAGQFDLTADGTKLFLNAVQYMAPLKIALVNASFEDPNQGKIKGWNGEGVGGTPAVDIPGWASDGKVNDSGVELGWTPTDGVFSAFMQQDDPMVYQLTNYTIQAGDIIMLTVDGRSTWQAEKLLMIISYVDNGVQVPVGFEEKDLTGSYQKFTLTFAADSTPECIGKKLGIEFANSTTRADKSAWLGLDNVRLAVMQTK